MLRKPVNSDEDMNYTLASAEAGLIYLDQVAAKASSLGVLQGTFSQWLLPYGEHTSASEQASRQATSAALAAIPECYRHHFSDKEVAYLIRGANSVRKLIRVKIADDADIRQAYESLKTAVRFYRKVHTDAKRRGVGPFDLLAKQRELERVEQLPGGGGLALLSPMVAGGGRRTRF